MRAVIFILLFLMSLCLAFALLFLVDISISYSYLKSSYESQVQHKDIILELLENEWIGKEKEVIAKSINDINNYGDNTILVKESKELDLMTVNELTLFFENNKLIKIE
ncbi:Imm58 family immunity protein [Vreelandella sp. EE7]